MGYTHYWRRPEHLDSDSFKGFAADVRKIIAVSAEIGIKLAGGRGDGTPDIGDTSLSFNGLEACGHTSRDLGIAWPKAGARGLADDGESARAGSWFAGAQLSSRQCGGDCSHETFRLAVNERKRPGIDDDGRVFNFTKTAYKPYDITVTAALIAAKRWFGDAIEVSSDGEDNDWEDGRMVCQVACGYGEHFHLGSEGHLEQAAA